MNNIEKGLRVSLNRHLANIILSRVALLLFDVNREKANLGPGCGFYENVLWSESKNRMHDLM